MQTLLRQIGILIFIGLVGGVSAFADETVVKQILDDPDLFSREEVKAIRERSKSLAETQASSIVSIFIKSSPSLDVVERKYGKSDSTLDSMPIPPQNRSLTIHWYGNLGLAVPKGNAKRPIVALFVEGPKELP